MSRSALKNIPLRANPFSGLAPKVHWVLFSLFLMQIALVCLGLWVPALSFGGARWPEGLLLVLATATTVSALLRQLPGQNIILAATIIVFIAGAIHVVGATTAIPFGPIVYTDRLGQMLFHPLPWALPVIWVFALLTSRGIGRLILRPWRKTQNYGFWLMGLTALLVILFDLSLEPYATQVRKFRLWNPS